MISTWSKSLEKDNDDDKYIGVPCKESITDSETAINVMYVCKLDVDKIGFFTRDELWFDRIYAWYNPSKNPNGLYTWDGENYYGKYQNSSGEIKYFKLTRRFDSLINGDLYDINKTINRFGEEWNLVDYDNFYKCE